MQRIVLACIVTLFFATAAQAGSWTARQKDPDIIETSGTAAVENLRVNAYLAMSCNRHGRPVAWLDYTIANADNVTKVFDLQPFEGPYAPAQEKALVTVELEGGTMAKPLTAHASGWMSAEYKGGFGFGLGGRSKEAQAISNLIKRMAREGTLLRIRITSFGKPKRTIVSEFPLEGSRDVFKALAAHCR